ncbi:MAG TPA: alpha/beta fold hydrolase [Spirochaetia bacterium]|nr:alpha/beta fold hydrolase [Spirochaetia bacterium]
MLVPGIWDSAEAYHRMAARLSAAGWSVFAVSLHPSDGSVRMEQSAAELERLIEEKLGVQRPFDLVGFSMGGIIARYYAQRMNGLDRILRLVLISTPNHGTRTAYLESLSGVTELRPGSTLLADLAVDEGRLASIPVTSIWSPYDLAIEPPTSSRMPFGREVVLPVLSHAWMLTDDRTIQAVIEALEQPR